MKALAIFGAVVLFLLFALSISLTLRTARRAVSLPPETVAPSAERVGAIGNGLLGELGSVCGGEKRLPCRPGTMCSVEMDGEMQGICIKEQVVLAPLAQFGEACGGSLPFCSPGLFCRKDASRGSELFCAKLNENAPFIVSLKLEGMTPEAGIYHAPAGTKVRLVIQATNAERVAVLLDGKSLGEAKKDVGGKFVADFVVEIDLDAELRVTAFQKEEFSSLAVKVVADT